MIVCRSCHEIGTVESSRVASRFRFEAARAKRETKGHVYTETIPTNTLTLLSFLLPFVSFLKVSTFYYSVFEMKTFSRGFRFHRYCVNEGCIRKEMFPFLVIMHKRLCVNVA